MAREIEPLEQINRHAVGHLGSAQAQQNNLSVNRPIFEKGEEIGPPEQREILAEECSYWLWCWIFSSFTQPYHDYVLARTLRPADFYRKLNKAVPALRKAIIPESVNALRDLRRKLVAKIKKH